MNGPWYDLVLLLLLAGVLYLFYRLQARAVSTPSLDGESDEAPRRRPGYFSRTARQAGYDPRALVWLYWLAKIALAVILPLACLELWAVWQGRPGWLTLTILAAAGFFLPDLWLWSSRRRRIRRIRYALSYFLDLVVSLLHSGLGLEDAFRRAAREGLEPEHPLAHEAGLVDLELGAGKDRAAAFEAMADRTGVSDFKAVAAALKLGLRLGNPVQETLDAQAELLRTKRREEARRAISLAPLKTLLPLLLCGFPVFLVLVMFPALVELATIFSELQSVLGRL